jgi:hypothetical protein
MQCPVCKGAAVDIGPKDFDGRVFRCTAGCRDYEVAGTSMLRFLAASPDNRMAALEKAKSITKRGERPSINSLCI